MKVGDYVRTETGQIGKITYFEGDMVRVDCDKFITYKSNHNEITKISPNIRDLIEKHDILKIEEQKGIYTICEVEEFREPYEEYTFLGVRLDNRPIARKLYELNIKSIVTKEQFSQMEYKVNE